MVALASDSPLDPEAWEAALGDVDTDWRAIDGADLESWADDAPVLTDDRAPVDQLLTPYP